MSDAVSSRQSRVSSSVDLHAKYLHLASYLDFVSVSRKITNDGSER